MNKETEDALLEQCSQLKRERDDALTQVRNAENLIAAIISERGESGELSIDYGHLIAQQRDFTLSCRQQEPPLKGYILGLHHDDKAGN